jgi:hypothetical protein
MTTATTPTTPTEHKFVALLQGGLRGRLALAYCADKWMGHRVPIVVLLESDGTATPLARMLDPKEIDDVNPPTTIQTAN